MTVSLRPSSNRTGGFPASGFPRAIHAHRFYTTARFQAAVVGSRYRPERSRRTSQQFSVEAVEPVARRSLGFAVECALQLLDFRGRCYPVEKRFRFRPAIIPSLALSAHVDPSAPPWLAAGFTLRQVFTPTRDSDYSGSPHRLGGFATLRDGLSH